MGKQEENALTKSKAAILFFLVFALLQGSFFIKAMGALTFPDPNIHAYASYAVATGQILTKTEHRVDKQGNKIKVQRISGDSRFLDLHGCHNALVVSILNETSSYDPHIEAQRAVDHLASGKEITVPSRTRPNRSNQYFPAIYLPQAIGIWIGLHTHQSPYQTWQLGRMSNLLLYIILFSLAIAIIPRGKMFMAVIGALPHGMFIASSLMSDALFISLCAVFIALFMAITTRREQASRKEMIAISALTVLLFMCKIVYASLAILILVLPRRILSTKRKSLYLGASAITAIAVYGTWSVLYSTTWAEASISNNLRFMLHHPFRIFVTIAWNALREAMDLLRLGAPSIIFVIILGLAWGLLYHNSHLNPHKVTSTREFISRYRYQITALLASLVLICLVYASMMMTWNSLPLMKITDPVQGIQARYLEPFLPLLVCTVFHPSEEDVAVGKGPGEECEKTNPAGK